MNALLEVEDVSITYSSGRSFFGRDKGGEPTVRGVSLSVESGRSVGLVGESGSGKSSVAKAIVGLQSTSAGRILFEGRRIDDASSQDRRRLGRDIQMVFQDPFASLNPRLTVRQAIAVAWKVQRIEPPGGTKKAVDELLEMVGLSPAVAGRYPHQFSGGQRQRVGIARAIALRPKLVVCDEAVSALDVSIRAQIINLLEDLQQELGLSYLFIAHDLSIVEHLCQEVVVMRKGEVVETGPTHEVFDDPQEQYTRDLLKAIPVTHPWRHASTGEGPRT